MTNQSPRLHPVEWFGAHGRYSRAIDTTIAIGSLALFVYCLADWLGWTPERGFQPLRMVFLSGALVLQPLASLSQRRSMMLFSVLLAASIALVLAAFNVAR